MNTQFEDFIKNNKITHKHIPQPIQDKMDIYKHMQTELSELSKEDKPLMEEKLALLDDELFDDLLNEFEDALNHNEVQSKSKAQPYKSGDTVALIGGNPKFIGGVFKVLQYYPKGKSNREIESVLLETNGMALERMLMDIRHVKKTTKKANEDILEEYEKSGKKKDKLTKSQLKALGLVLDFTQWEIPVGKFRLYRVNILSLHFRLNKVESLPVEDR